jgi:erythrin-vacuolar iron transport family protein
MVFLMLYDLALVRYTIPVSEEHHFLLQRVQPAMVGLIDGSLSTLAPIFGIVFYTHKPHAAFVAGVATAIGAAISMAFSEGLSDTGELTGRGSPAVRGSITGVGTFIGGILHTLPFLLSNYHVAVLAAAIVVAFELIGLAIIRWRFFDTGFVRSLVAVSIGGAVIAVVGALIGSGA